ncbi:hypothetical protein ACLM5H_18285 [Fredinandcohnia humi]
MQSVLLMRPFTVCYLINACVMLLISFSKKTYINSLLTVLLVVIVAVGGFMFNHDFT